MVSFDNVMRPYRIAWFAVAFTLASVPVRAAIVDFEEPDVTFGTVYGVNAMPPNNMGDTVLVQNGIAMNVEGFLTGAPNNLTLVFDEAVVGGHYFADFPKLFDSTPLQLTNISVLFDFQNVAPVTSVTIGFHHFDGTLNLKVNEQIWWNNFFSFDDLPQQVAPRIDLTVGNDLLTLTSSDGVTAIDTFLIGGQELTIDNVNGVPEPSMMVLIGIGAIGIYRTRRRSFHPQI